MNIKNIFKDPAGLYFLNTKNNIMKSILEIKKESIKKGNLRIFALGFNESIKSRILETNKEKYGCRINILRKEKSKILSKDYRTTSMLDCDVVLINLNNMTYNDKLNIIRLFHGGHKVIIFSENNLNKKEFLKFYKQQSEEENLELDLIF